MAARSRLDATTSLISQVTFDELCCSGTEYNHIGLESCPSHKDLRLDKRHASLLAHPCQWYLYLYHCDHLRYSQLSLVTEAPARVNVAGSIRPRLRIPYRFSYGLTALRRAIIMAVARKVSIMPDGHMALFSARACAL